MMQPSGIANRGRAYIYGSQADFSPLEEIARQRMLRRSQAAEQELQRQNAYSSALPDVSGDVFFGDIAGLRERMGTLVDELGQIKSLGLDPSDVSNPLVAQYVQDELEYRMLEGQSKQRQKRYANSLQEYQKLLAEDKVLPGYQDEILNPYLQNYTPFQDQGIPSFQGFESYDLNAHVSEIGKAIEAGTTSSLYNNGVLYGTKEISGRDSKALEMAADQSMANQKYARAIGRGYQSLSDADKAGIQLRAEQAGISPEMQYSRDFINQSLGGISQEVTARERSASSRGFSKEQEDNMRIAKATVQQVSDAALAGPEELVRFFQGQSFGDTDEVIERVDRDDEGNLRLVTVREIINKADELTGRPEERQLDYRQYPLTEENLFEELITPAIIGQYGTTRGTQIMSDIYKYYEDELGGNSSQFDPTLTGGAAIDRLASPPRGQRGGGSRTTVTASNRYGGN